MRGRREWARERGARGGARGGEGERERGREGERERERERERGKIDWRLKLELEFSFHVQAQLLHLPPLVVPKRLIHKGWRTGRREEEEEGEGEGKGKEEGGSSQANQTDQEKSVAKETANLLEVRPPLGKLVVIILSHSD